MFLLIPLSATACWRRPNPIYIPLCFYLYIPGIYIRVTALWIYIPLCFYLYYKSVVWRRYNAYIYIPLCFYLYFFVLTDSSFSITYLHSTMFLLILSLSRTDWTLKWIYIPLCFYLYVINESPSDDYPNLHSTMFLLIRFSAWSVYQENLHLHSTMFLLILRYCSCSL